MKTEERAAIDVVKKARSGTGDDPDIIELSTGVTVRLLYVSSSTLADVAEKIKLPDVPIFVDEKKGREEPNYADPGYQEALAEANLKRANAMMNVIAMLGVELINGLPDNDSWMKKLKILDRVGSIDLSGYDLNDQIELEFLFKKHVAIGSEDWELIFARSGISEEGIEQQSGLFRR